MPRSRTRTRTDTPAGGTRGGRGSLSNRSGRFEALVREAVDDGWTLDDDEAPPLRTTVTVDASRSVISYNRSPDIPFDRSINAYRGCEHGCVYCFARPSHAYLGLSPGQDFESRLFAKPDAAALLARELAAPGYRCAPIALGTNTDPYQPVERQWKITRQILEVLDAHEHPVTIVTKSALVLRDRDILAAMAARNLARVALSVTTLDRRLARAMEPRAATPGRRLDAVKGLAEAGIPVAVMAAPMIPALNDDELEAILEAAVAAGADSAGYVALRLPLEIKGLFEEWLQVHCPDRASRVLAQIREIRGGRLNDSGWGQRMTGTGARAELLRQRFRLACRRLGLNRSRRPLDTARFRIPPRPGDQLTLL